MQTNPQSTRLKNRVAPAIGLFFLAPLVAEYLLGNLPIKLLPALIVLAPMYGGGALLIRETVRRIGRGWPSILVLAVAFGILEEAFTTQSLFNPDYLKMGMGLLKPAYISVLGIGGWWSIFVLNLHTAWSIMTPIALVEALVPDRATTPWLRRTGLGVAGAIFVLGIVATTLLSFKRDHFVASSAQFGCAAAVCVALTVVAFRLSPRHGAGADGNVPKPWLAGLIALAAGSAILLTPSAWGWRAVAAILCIDLSMAGAVLYWSRRTAWSRQHILALASGAAMAYAWHSFVEKSVIPGSLLGVRIGNAIFTLGAMILIAIAARRLPAAIRETTPDPGASSIQQEMTVRP